MPVRERNDPTVSAAAPILIEAGDPVNNWRYAQLIKHGLDPDRANRASISKDFDIEQFRALRLAGCDRDMAYEIVR